jgi:hypothetical protein
LQRQTRLASVPDQDVHYRLEGIAASLDVGGPGTSFVAFTIGDLTVMIAHAEDGDQTVEDSRIVVEGVRATPEEVVDLLLEREEYMASKEPGSGGGTGLDREQITWMLNPPAALVTHLSMTAAEMRAAATRLVQTLRWVLHKTSTVQPLASAELSWSPDGYTWYSAPPNLGNQAGFVGDFDRHTLTPGATAEIVQRLLDDPDFSEPLARQILLEAGALVDGNPRAASVLAVAAAEVGMKQYVARISRPSEAWLIGKLPAPPLTRLMTDYFQLLQGASDLEVEPFAIPARLRSTFQEWIERRNDIVHQGLDPPEPEQVEELLHAVDEFLYMLDWASGQRWAALYLPAELRPAPADE